MKCGRFFLLFIFLVYMVNDHSVDAASVAGSLKTVLTLPLTLPLKIATLPVKIATLPINIVTKLPSLVIKEVVSLSSKILKIIGNIESNGITDISQLIQALVSMIQEIVTSIVNGLVSIGVFQGKSAEEIINFIMTAVKTIFAFLGNTEMKLSSSLVDTLMGIIKTLKIKDILNMPGVKIIKDEVINIYKILKKLYGKKVSLIMNLVKDQINKHRDFFQPIFNSISSRILIVVNAAQALLSGELNSCPGNYQPNKSPANSLMWQLNVWLDKFTVNLFKILGLTDWAEKAQAKLDGELAQL